MKKHFLDGIFCFGLAWILGGCATIARDPFYQGPFLRPNEWAKSFTYSIPWTQKQEDRGGYSQIVLEWKSDTQPSETHIVMDYYPCRESGRRPAILISPILGGKNEVATHFARYLSRRGYHCLIVHRPKDLTRDLETIKQLDTRLKEAVIRDRLALDWLCAQPEVDSEAVGSFGVSYGAIKNVILAGVDSRLKANIFGLAGADMPSLVMLSNHEVLQRLRNRLPENKQVSHEIHENMAKSGREEIEMEPLRYAPFVDPQSTLIILARNDRTVPRSNGEQLRKALGYPRTVYLPCAHYSAAFFTGMFGLPYIESLTREFFDTHLYKEDAR